MSLQFLHRINLAEVSEGNFALSERKPDTLDGYVANRTEPHDKQWGRILFVLSSTAMIGRT